MLLKIFLIIFLLSKISLTATNPITIDTVYIGNLGNSADPMIGFGNSSLAGFGNVDYGYSIGKYEVTNQQYTTFLNSVASKSDQHGLYNSYMSSNRFGGILRTGVLGNYSYELKDSTWGQKPVNMVSFWDAVRFANWMTTGGADTENGLYSLNNVTNPDNRSITRNTDVSGFAI